MNLQWLVAVLDWYCRAASKKARKSCPLK